MKMKREDLMKLIEQRYEVEGAKAISIKSGYSPSHVSKLAHSMGLMCRVKKRYDEDCKTVKSYVERCYNAKEIANETDIKLYRVKQIAKDTGLDFTAIREKRVKKLSQKVYSLKGKGVKKDDILKKLDITEHQYRTAFDVAKPAMSGKDRMKFLEHLIKTRYPTEGPRYIAQITGFSLDAVSSKANRLNVSYIAESKAQLQLVSIKNLYDKDYFAKEISAELGIALYRVKALAKKAGLNFNDTMKRRRLKLGKDVKELKEQGYTKKTILSKLNISDYMYRKILIDIKDISTEKVKDKKNTKETQLWNLAFKPQRQQYNTA